MIHRQPHLGFPSGEIPLQRRSTKLRTLIAICKNPPTLQYFELITDESGLATILFGVGRTPTLYPLSNFANVGALPKQIKFVANMLTSVMDPSVLSDSKY